PGLDSETWVPKGSGGRACLGHPSFPVHSHVEERSDEASAVAVPKHPSSHFLSGKLRASRDRTASRIHHIPISECSVILNEAPFRIVEWIAVFAWHTAITTSILLNFAYQHGMGALGEQRACILRKVS